MGLTTSWTPWLRAAKQYQWQPLTESQTLCIYYPIEFSRQLWGSCYYLSLLCRWGTRGSGRCNNLLPVTRPAAGFQSLYSHHYLTQSPNGWEYHSPASKGSWMGKIQEAPWIFPLYLSAPMKTLERGGLIRVTKRVRAWLALPFLPVNLSFSSLTLGFLVYKRKITVSTYHEECVVIWFLCNMGITMALFLQGVVRILCSPAYTESQKLHGAK